jgi:hypothetical protein
VAPLALSGAPTILSENNIIRAAIITNQKVNFFITP